ncbi:hypothetical protein HK098_003313 [Nowakowskiella sp. JEL0407]|nr:hypothetical protein HK098_003313 [Nowakowskiella sp. JEL0407]
MKISRKWLSLAFLCLGVNAQIGDEKADQDVVKKVTSIKAPFLEQFTSDWDTRWYPSTAKKIIDGVEDDALLAYRGEWEVEKGGLVVKTAAAHHAISAAFKQPVNADGKNLVVQYQVKLSNGLECGGAYIKLLTANDSFVAEKFSDKTPYTIMFGPDRCGATNKVHFIFRHKNPVTGDFEEKHLNLPPTAKMDKNTNLYTLIVKPDQTFEILINNNSEKKGSLLEDFTPAVNPPKEIEDSEDKKPADWVDEAKIPDPDAKKPDDWDDDAPFEVLDVDAVKPDDWYEEEPLLIPDPDAKKPEDWDDEEDGDWVAPQIGNPKCEKASGCGPWVRPMKHNPNYKGKWQPEMIDNPAYKGEWKPKKIPNPAYFEDKNPAKFNPIGAIGIELWTMQDNIVFDNIYVGHSIEDAKKLSLETWKPIFDSEEAANKVEEKKQEEETKKDEPKKSFFDELLTKVTLFIGKLQKDPRSAIEEDPQTAGAIFAVVLIPVLGLLALLSSGPAKATPAKKEKKGDKEEKKVEAKVVKDKKDGAKQRKNKKEEKDEDDE